MCIGDRFCVEQEGEMVVGWLVVGRVVLMWVAVRFQKEQEAVMVVGSVVVVRASPSCSTH